MDRRIAPIITLAALACCGAYPQQSPRGTWDVVLANLPEGGCESPAGASAPATPMDWRHLGRCQLQAGEDAQAIASLQRALDGFTASGDQPDEAEAAAGLGAALRHAGRPQDASSAYRRELEVCRIAEVAGCQASALFDLSELDDENHDIRQGTKDLNDALTVAAECQCRTALLAAVERIAAIEQVASTPEGRADALKWLGFLGQMGRDYDDLGAQELAARGAGEVEMAAQQWMQAIADLESALLPAAEEGDAAAAATLHEDLAEAHAGAGQRDAAMAEYKTAAESRQVMGDDQREGLDRFRLGEMMLQAGRAPEAVCQLQRAADLTETVRATIPNPDDRMEYMRYQTPVPAELAGALAQLWRTGDTTGIAAVCLGGYTDFGASAFYYAEMGRARSLAETVAASRRADLAQDGVLSAGQAATYAELQTKVDATRRAVDSPGVHRRADYDDAKNGLAQFTAQLWQDPSPRVRAWAAFMFPAPVHAADVPLRPGEALLEYMVLKDEVLVWRLASGSSPRLFSLRVGVETLRQQVISLAGMLAHPGLVRSIGTQGPVGATSAARRELESTLYTELLAQPLADLNPDTRLVIVPDDALRVLPFEIFGHERGGSFHYLGEEREITYYPSATVMTAERLGAATSQAGGLPTLLAIADPADATPIKFGGGDTLVRSGFELGGLPGAQAEVKAIGQLFSRPEVLIGAQARKGLLEAMNANGELVGYRFLHLATHGLLAHDIPGLNEPALLLAPVEGPEANSFLTLSDVTHLRLGAQVVVLSACKTGLGEAVPGEGVVGLTRAFLYAGSTAVVVSLWSVDDVSTSHLMQTFYQRVLRDHLSLSEAMREARVEEKKEKPDEFYWGAFVMVGEGGD